MTLSPCVTLIATPGSDDSITKVPLSVATVIKMPARKASGTMPAASHLSQREPGLALLLPAAIGWAMTL